MGEAICAEAHPKRQEQEVPQEESTKQEGVDGSVTGKGHMETGRKRPSSPVLMGAVYIYQLSCIHDHAERQRAAR